MNYKEKIKERIDPAIKDDVDRINSLKAENSRVEEKMSARLTASINKLFGFTPEENFEIEIGDLWYGDIQIQIDHPYNNIVAMGYKLMTVRTPNNYLLNSKDDIRIVTHFNMNKFVLGEVNKDANLLNIYATLLNKLTHITNSAMDEFSIELAEISVELNDYYNKYWNELDSYRNNIKSTIANIVATTSIEYNTSLKDMIASKHVKYYRNNYVTLFPVFVEFKTKTVKLMYILDEEEDADSYPNDMNKSNTMKKADFFNELTEYFYNNINMN